MSSPQIFLRIFCVFGSFDAGLVERIQELVRAPWRSTRSASPPPPDPGRCRWPPRPRRLPRLRRSSFAASSRSSAIIFGILRLGDFVRRVRIDEADDDVDQAHLAGLDRSRRPAAEDRRSPGRCRARDRTASRPSSMRLAMRISPSRVSSSTVPISRMYMRTGSVVRPNSASRLASAAAASSTASSSGGAGASVSSSDSASGAFSYTGMPMSLIMLTMSSICSGSTISLGRWSLTSA